MSKVKKKEFNYQSKTISEEPRMTKKMRNILIAIAAIVVVIIVVLLCIENSMRSKVVVKNKSSQNISSRKFWYEDENGIITDVMELGAVDANQKVSKSTFSVA